MPSTYTSLHYHFVFGTKNREPMITPAIREKLYRYVGGVLARHRGVLIEIGGMPDHVHILAGLPASLSVSQAMKAVKGAASRWVSEELGEVFGWQPGYAAFTVSESQMPRVRRYIQRQPEHHRNLSFHDEVRRLLERHHVDFPKEKLFDD